MNLSVGDSSGVANSGRGMLQIENGEEKGLVKKGLEVETCDLKLEELQSSCPKELKGDVAAS